MSSYVFLVLFSMQHIYIIINIIINVAIGTYNYCINGVYFTIFMYSSFIILCNQLVSFVLYCLSCISSLQRFSDFFSYVIIVYN